jgi:hypothetical protein
MTGEEPILNSITTRRKFNFSLLPSTARLRRLSGKNAIWKKPGRPKKKNEVH